jgi:hypothetical protein
MCEEKQELTKEDPSTSLRTGKLKKAKELMDEIKELELSPEELEKVDAGFWGSGWSFPPTFNK